MRMNEPFAIEALGPPGWQHHRGSARIVCAARRRLGPEQRARSRGWRAVPPEPRVPRRRRLPPVPATDRASTRSPAANSISGSDTGELVPANCISVFTFIPSDKLRFRNAIVI